MSSLTLQRRSYVAGVSAGSVGCALLFALAWRVIDHLPQYDELFHFLAARGIRDHGLPAIADGIYDRAEWFTRLVAIAIETLGDSLVAARIPSLLASAGLLMLMTIWVTRRVGLLAGFTAAIVLCLLPVTLDLAVFIRFYTLHALLVMGMAIALYEAAEPERTFGQRIGLALLAAAVTLVALHFQVTTVIALAAVAAGVAAVVLPEHWNVAAPFIRRHALWLTIVAVVAMVAGGFAATKLGMVDDFLTAPLWGSPSAHRPQYYLLEIAREAPLLWPMFPVAVLIALFFGNRRLTTFCVVALLFALFVHSIAAAKTMRYIYYALPFLCVIWGCALSGLYAALTQVDARRLALGHRNLAPLALLVAAVVLALSQEGQLVARTVFGKLDSNPKAIYDGETAWSPAVPTLQPLVSSADRVVTSNAMKALYYFGRYDYDLNATIVPETQSGEEFGLDERTGRHAISTARSIAQVLGMPGKTIVILEEMRLGNPAGVPANSVETIGERCSPVALPPTAGLRAWSCANTSSP
jgi:hypothetical protein